jgi:hypothetical protein
MIGASSLPAREQKLKKSAKNRAKMRKHDCFFLEYPQNGNVLYW